MSENPLFLKKKKEKQVMLNTDGKTPQIIQDSEVPECQVIRLKVK